MCEFPLELANPESPTNYREQEPFRGCCGMGEGSRWKKFETPGHDREARGLPGMV